MNHDEKEKEYEKAVNYFLNVSSRSTKPKTFGGTSPRKA
jgi:hypothetical protein